MSGVFYLRDVILFIIVSLYDVFKRVSKYEFTI